MDKLFNVFLYKLDEWEKEYEESFEEEMAEVRDFISIIARKPTNL